jgi:hypothetical protein
VTDDARGDGARDAAREAGREIALRDEVLELLFWLEGEGFTEHATLAGLMRFLAFPAEDVRATVAQLVARGEVVAGEDESLRLSAEGRREAARRFAEEFAPLLRQGHGECNDPDCDCHTNPAGAAECHAARAREGHGH